MAYNRRGYRGGYRRSSSGGKGSRWMQLHYDGVCKACGQDMPKGSTGFWDQGARTMTCERIECAQADGLTVMKYPTGPWDKWEPHPVLGDHRIGDAAAIHEAALRAARASHARGGPKVHVTTFSSGATVFQNARGRCEDAPCCGCCSY